MQYLIDIYLFCFIRTTELQLCFSSSCFAAHGTCPCCIEQQCMIADIHLLPVRRLLWRAFIRVVSWLEMLWVLFMLHYYYARSICLHYKLVLFVVDTRRHHKYAIGQNFSTLYLQKCWKWWPLQTITTCINECVVICSLRWLFLTAALYLQSLYILVFLFASCLANVQNRWATLTLNLVLALALSLSILYDRSHIIFMVCFAQHSCFVMFSKPFHFLSLM